MLDSGQFKSKAELARHLGVSRVRVIQVLNLLKLDKQVINKLREAGETLRPLVCLTPTKQMEKISSILSG